MGSVCTLQWIGDYPGCISVICPVCAHLSTVQIGWMDVKTNIYCTVALSLLCHSIWETGLEKSIIDTNCCSHAMRERAKQSCWPHRVTLRGSCNSWEYKAPTIKHSCCSSVARGFFFLNQGGTFPLPHSTRHQSSQPQLKMYIQVREQQTQLFDWSKYSCAQIHTFELDPTTAPNTCLPIFQ